MDFKTCVLYYLYLAKTNKNINQLERQEETEKNPMTVFQMLSSNDLRAIDFLYTLCSFMTKFSSAMRRDLQLDFIALIVMISITAEFKKFSLAP